MIRLPVPNNQDVNELEFEDESQDNSQLLKNKNNQNVLPKGKQMDVYENDEMIDCFMDDIDEMSMCEGSR